MALSRNKTKEMDISVIIRIVICYYWFITGI